jgi:two-component system chemotaxis response regulator CheB
MGCDGAHGMLELNRAGKSINLAQDEASSVVYGMPKEAVHLGAVDFQGDIPILRSYLELVCQQNLIFTGKSKRKPVNHS